MYSSWPGGTTRCSQDANTVRVRYCLLLKRTRLTFKRGYSPLTIATTVMGKTKDPVKNISLYHCITFFPLGTIFLAVLFIRSLKSILYSVLTTHKSITLLSYKHKMRLYFYLVYSQSACVSYWSQAKNGSLTQAQNFAKVNCDLHSNYLHLNPLLYLF
jgi:hypothetical protein